MATTYSERVPTWFWVAAGLVLVWEAMGCYAYITQVSMTAEQLAALPEGQRQLFNTMPDWVTAAYGIATWGGLLAAILLLMRKRWATAMFAVSLVALLVQFGWSFLIADAGTVVGPSAYGLPAFIIVAGVALLWFSSNAAKRGWLR
jgi:uncharacterized protein YjeT (DUF2065 family)